MTVKVISGASEVNTVPIIYHNGNPLHHGPMDAQQVRTEKIRSAVAAAGGPTNFAERYGSGRWSQAQVSQWINAKSPKPIGTRLARALEDAMGWRHGEMDYISDSMHRSDAASAPMVDHDKYAFVTRIHGPLLAAGNGYAASNVEEVDHSHAFRRDWLASKGLHADQCHIVGVCGDSMLPALPGGCVVLVDTSDTAPIKNGRVYAIVMNGEARVKRLFDRVDGALEIRSDNSAPQYAPEVIAPEYRNRVTVVGRVRWSSAEWE